MKRIIGIAGGVGAGKSTVLDILKEKYDAHIFIADEVGHTALYKNTPTYKIITDHFGANILEENGDISPKLLADRIFNDENERHFINSIIHPYVKEKISEDIRAWQEIDKELYILETALLFETSCDRLCDEVWGVICNTNIRIERLMHTRGYTRDKALSIISSQISDEELKNRCDRLIDNSQTRDKLIKQIETLIK